MFLTVAKALAHRQSVINFVNSHAADAKKVELNKVLYIRRKIGSFSSHHAFMWIYCALAETIFSDVTYNDTM
jgi:hypothetical protein